ncbi:plasma membrane calcium-transporting ATPase 2-like [Condylostylus longicornis]|uniref:plasma membrane calcium-transporting ATPase 2-like n=1 Tax=Condylostylus longicornis TaxID=2530218 RepID=UPI00244DF860|nr:plasma membrane calcium-transporting ATPase 2-like [Condylostylus longicornis]
MNEFKDSRTRNDEEDTKEILDMYATESPKLDKKSGPERVKQDRTIGSGGGGRVTSSKRELPVWWNWGKRADGCVKKTAEGLCEALRTTAEEGTSDDLHLQELRKEVFSTNVNVVRKATPFWYLLWTASKDFILRVLMAAGIVSLILGLVFGERKEIEWIEGAAIFLAVVIVLLVTAGNDWMKERQFAALVQKDEKHCSCRRDGHLHQISTESLLVGDIILVEAGDEIPTDCLVLSCRDLSLDESSMTGESHTVRKSSLAQSLVQRNEAQQSSPKAAQDLHRAIKSPVVLSGSVVTDGSGILLVVAVGGNSEAGQLLQKLSIDVEPTPLQNKLNALARDIGNVGFAAACLTLLVLIIQYWILFAVHPEDRTDSNFGDVTSSHIQFLVEAITIVVVAVPEGLPLAVTLSLAFSVGRMLKDQNYVRRLAACETMGGANEICSDKTGTLTKNQMAVEAFWNGSKLSEVHGRTTLPHLAEGELNIDTGGVTTFSFPRLLPNYYSEILFESIALNSTAYLEEVSGAKVGNLHPVGAIKHIGSPTECALLEFLINMGSDYNKIRAEKGTEDKIIQRIPFNSERKLMTTVIKCPDPEKPQHYRVYVKGAVEIVLRLCRSRIDSAGNLRNVRNVVSVGEEMHPIRTIEPVHIERIERQVVDQMTCQALRTICLAYKDFNPNEEKDWNEFASQSDRKFYKMELGLACLGLAGMRDPLREEVPAAVRRCQDAGIRVRMVTGDNIETAKQIGIKCNIYHPETGGLAMTGSDFYATVGGIICENCRTAECDSKRDRGTSVDKEEVERLLVKKTRVDVLGNMDAFEKIAEKLEVLARSQPTDKYALVVGLRSLGAVVAVTGDGTNDAPALKKADVGFAMGIAGKEVAKQAADIVLLDDNFESIVRAVKWGRNIYDNIRRFLQFQLTVNVVAVITAFIGAVILRSSPLNAVQLLWVNLIMDTFASLALATEPPTEGLLDRPPHSRNEYLVNRLMTRNILGQAAYQLAVMMVLIFTADSWIPEKSSPHYEQFEGAYGGFSQFSTHGDGHTYVTSGRRFTPFSNHEEYKRTWTINIGPSRHYTVVFNTFVWLQIFNMINARQINDEN